MSTERFYSELPIHPFNAVTLFQDQSLFTEIPADWYVLCTDVEKSTSFYLEGRWDIVNKLAAAGIDVVLRASIARGLEIPYVYGGDGILACFPPLLLKEITSELALLYQYGHAVCGANLRIGIVPVKDIHRAGHNLRIKRVGSMGTISHTLFDDSAFAWIDSVVKNKTEYNLISMLTDVDVSRLKYDEYILPVWQKIETAYEGEEYLALIIVPCDTQQNRLSIYNEILTHLDVYAPRFFESHPIISLEKDDVFSLDFIKTDGALKVIVSTKHSNIQTILSYITQMEQAGHIVFGHTVSKSSIITYVIKESEDYMAGLLDLESGGYVAAAQELKSKIAEKASD